MSLLAKCGGLTFDDSSFEMSNGVIKSKSGATIVNIKKVNSSWTSDKTYAEIKTLVANGTEVVAKAFVETDVEGVGDYYIYVPFVMIDDYLS